MWVTAVFLENNVPQTGLSPTIKIYKMSDQSVVVNGAAMSELGDGIYYYDFSAYGEDEDYSIVCDGGVALTNRYSYSNSAFDDLTTPIAALNTLATQSNQILKGRWKIVSNQMIMYDSDDTTPLFTFDLKDLAGNPSMNTVFERDPV